MDRTVQFNLRMQDLKMLTTVVRTYERSEEKAMNRHLTQHP